ncbi:MAG: protein kinase [Myxococcales bacterium]|nr:protein kinase [Myxococcales bacterium]
MVAPATAVGTALTSGVVVAERYQVVRLLGRGGMGEVYAAHDRLLGLEVALKTVAAERGGAAADRLDRELTLARAIAHRNVCRMFDLAADAAGRRFVTMELVPGETLAERLHRGALDPSEAGAILDDLIAGLGAAHAAGVIHRDLKPGNVILARDAAGSRAVITDFGLARHQDDARESVTDFAGTPAYMAPEQLTGRRVTTAVDVYALGVVAYELLTGHLPFEHPDDVTSRGLGRLAAPVPSVGAAGGRDARRWDHFIHACTALDPGARPATTALAHLRTAAPPRRRARALALGVGLAIVAASTATAAVALRPHPAPAPRRDRGARVPLAFTVGGVGRDNVNAVAWHRHGDLVLGGYAGPGGTLAGRGLVRDPTLERSAWVARTDDRGRPRWVWRTAGAHDARVVDVAVAPDGDVVAVGWYYDEVDVGGQVLPRPPQDADGFVIRLDGATGARKWALALGAHHAGAPRAVEVDAAGDVYVAGEYGGATTFGGDAIAADSGGTLDARAPFVLALDGAGRRRWLVAARGRAARIFGLTTDGARVFVSGIVWGGTYVGDLELGARSIGDGVVLALDAGTGAVAWTHRFDSAQAATAMGAVARAGRLVVTGNFRYEATFAGVRHETAGPFGAWVADLDPGTGAERWSTAVTGPGMANPSDVALDDRGHAWVVGKFTDEVGVGDLRLRSGGGEDGLVLELDGAGRALGLEQLGGRGGERLRRIAAGPDGRLAIGGHYVGRLQAGRFDLISRGDADGLVLELDPKVTR